MCNENPRGKPQAKRRILVVDDHPVLRRGLTALIDGESDLIVCAVAAGHREGLMAIASSQPELVITDLSLTDGAGSDGLSLVAAIRSGQEDLPVLVFSMHEEPWHAERAFDAGAIGYVSKGEMGETILVAIRTVLGGEKFVSPKMRARLDTT